MKVEFKIDNECAAAYVDLTPDVNLDFDKDENLVGIELLGFHFQ